jgi:hypothetical protein
VRRALALAVLLLAGCGDESTTCRAPGEQYPRQVVSVAVARERDGELATVRGTVVARGGVPVKICSKLPVKGRPACEGRVLRLEGARDMSGFARTGGPRGKSWAYTRAAGRVVGDTLRVELSCRAQEVQEHIEEELGVRLTLNPLGTYGDQDRLDVASLERWPRDVKRRYGVFYVAVRTNRKDEPFWGAELAELARDGDIYWHRDFAGRWYVAKRYGDDVLLFWIAGSNRRVDERWRRLDRVLREL